MVQVTIEWQGCEIGYGVGESEAYAREEAEESVDSFYQEARAEWTYNVVQS